MNHYDEEAERIFDAARQEKLFGLIWGPGDPGPDGDAEAKKGYKKRCLIREVLKEKFPNSLFAFSEDIDEERVIGDLTKETVQAKAAHFIIILAISRGSHLEIDHFVPTYDWFPTKAWVFMPQKYLGSHSPGLLGEVLDLIPNKQIQGYTDQEFDDCVVAKQMSVQIVTTVATRLMLRGRF